MSLFDDASLVLIPDGAKDGTLYSVKPTDGTGDFTFTRGSNLAATRVDENGLIEKGRENLLKYSNAFTNAPWGGGGTWTPNQLGRDGQNNAWTLTKSGASNSDTYNELFSGLQTFSIYVKKDDANKGLSIYNFHSAGNLNASYNLSTGILQSATSGVIHSSLVEYNSTWWRMSVTANVINGQWYIYTTDGTSTLAVVTVTLQDAQLEVGLVATDYIETGATTAQAGILEDMPRLDYSGGTCPALLLEPQRTNLHLQSEYIHGWVSKSNITTTANYTTSPQGVKNATRLQFTANGYIHNSHPAQVNGTQYTLSCYAKRNDSGTQNVGFFVNGSGNVDSAWSLTNDWQRFTYTYTASNTSQRGIAGLSGADVSVYGFQIEEGSYPTSYIPTYGTSVTRGAEGQTYSGFSSLIGQTEGTLFLEIDGAENATEIFSLNRSTANSIFLLGSSNTYRIYIWSDGIAYSQNTSIANTDRIKIAIAYKSNDFAIYANGSQVSTNNSLTWTPNITIDSLNFNVGAYVAGKEAAQYKQVMLIPERISNADLASLTTL